jgi:hypothetical protein
LGWSYSVLLESIDPDDFCPIPCTTGLVEKNYPSEKTNRPQSISGPFMPQVQYPAQHFFQAKQKQSAPHLGHGSITKGSLGNIDQPLARLRDENAARPAPLL